MRTLKCGGGEGDGEEGGEGGGSRAEMRRAWTVGRATSIIELYSISGVTHVHEGDAPGVVTRSGRA